MKVIPDTTGIGCPFCGGILAGDAERTAKGAIVKLSGWHYPNCVMRQTTATLEFSGSKLPTQGSWLPKSEINKGKNHE